MKFDDDGNIWIRQSWFGDYLLDPERARLKVVYPEADIGGDAAHCGSGAHSAVQLTLESLIAGGQRPTRRQIETVIRDTVDEKIETEGIRWQKFGSMAELLGHSQRCYEAWAREILPVLLERNLVAPGALCEYEFKLVLFELPGGRMGEGRTVGLTGTIDYVPPVPELWDWKNPGRAYKAREKQRYAVQPTAYCAAAVLGAIPNGVDYQWPLTFTYGEAVRGVKQARAHLTTVRRTQGHFDFMVKRIRDCVALVDQLGFDQPWPINDDHFLCSSTWCPWWDHCKGAHAIDDSIPMQLDLAA